MTAVIDCCALPALTRIRSPRLSLLSGFAPAQVLGYALRQAVHDAALTPQHISCAKPALLTPCPAAALPPACVLYCPCCLINTGRRAAPAASASAPEPEPEAAPRPKTPSKLELAAAAAVAANAASTPRATPIELPVVTLSELEQAMGAK